MLLMSSLSPGVVSRESGEKRNFDKTHRILAGLELVVCQIVLNIFIILCIRVPTQLPQSLRVWSQEIEQWNLILSLGQDRTISSWVHPLQHSKQEIHHRDLCHLLWDNWIFTEFLILCLIQWKSAQTYLPKPSSWKATTYHQTIFRKIFMKQFS